MAGSIEQLTTQQVQRLKSELGEVIIADFCNPRFMDYRADRLRSRPATRRQRREVWQYLESVDFNAVLRDPPGSRQFERRLEQIIMDYIGRNPAFQGRSEHAGGDARGRVHQAVVEIVKGFQGYLKEGERSRFGTPRPVESWTGQHRDLSWAAIEQSTRHMQESLLASRADDIALAQELTNGQATPTPYSTVLAALFPRSGGRPTLASPSMSHPAKPARPTGEPAVAGGPTEGLAEAHKPAGQAVQPPAATVPVVSGTDAEADQAAPAKRGALERLDQLYSQLLQEAAPAGGLEVHYLTETDAPAQVHGKDAAPHGAATTELPAVSLARGQKATGPAADAPAGPEAGVADQDTSLFTQLQQQVTIWIKVAAVSNGLDITHLPTAEIAAQLRRAAMVDETELTIATSLLELAERVQRAGSASLVDYKQALMLHLLHRRPRLLI